MFLPFLHFPQALITRKISRTRWCTLFKNIKLIVMNLGDSDQSLECEDRLKMWKRQQFPQINQPRAEVNEQTICKAGQYSTWCFPQIEKKLGQKVMKFFLSSSTFFNPLSSALLVPNKQPMNQSHFFWSCFFSYFGQKVIGKERKSKTSERKISSWNGNKIYVWWDVWWEVFERNFD